MGAQGHSGSAGALFAGLTPEERILFLRRYWWAEPVKTAAAHSGISPRRARSILERLRRDLRNELEKEEITL